MCRIGICLLWASTIRAGVIFDNFDEGGGFHPQYYSGAASAMIDPMFTFTSRAAAQFTVTGRDSTLNSITLPVSVDKASGAPNVFQVRLTEDNGGVPGTTIEVISSSDTQWPPSANPFTTTTTLTSTGHPVLLQGRSYWIVTELTALPAQNFDSRWFYNTTGNEVPFRQQQAEGSLPVDPWDGSLLASNIAFRVEGDPLPQIPQLINYQGRVAVGSPPVNFDGTGLFKFAMVAGGSSASLWSNDGTSTDGSEPTDAVQLAVIKGLYSVQLGDTALEHMTAIPYNVFANLDVRLRIWFNDGTHGFQHLEPDQRIAAVGYAMMAGNVPDGTITGAKLATGTVEAANIAAGAVGTTKLAPAAVLSSHIASGAVGSSQIAAASVGSAKLATGAVGTTQLGNSAVTSSKLAAGAVGATQLADNAVVSAKIATGAVGTTQLADNAVVSAKIANGAIGSAKLAANAVQAGNIAAGAVGSTQLATGAVQSANIADAAVGAAQVADFAITGDKLRLGTETGTEADGTTHFASDTLTFTGTFDYPFSAAPAVSLLSPGWTLGSVTASGFSATTAATIAIEPLTIEITGDVGTYTSLAIVDGMPAISYFDDTNGELRYVRATNVSGTAWATPVTIVSTGATYGSLAMVDGMPAICYYENTNADLKYVRATDAAGTVWATPMTIDSTGMTGGFCSLAVVNGHPAISYLDLTNLDLKYVRSTDAAGTAWATPVTVDSTANVGMFTSLVVVNGFPAMSYHDITNRDLKYVRANDVSGASWGTPVTVGSTGNTGWHTSMAVVDGFPAIGYIDSTNSELRYVRATDAAGSTWGTPMTLDSVDMSVDPINQSTSLAVVDGHPAISYYDITYGDLKYVRATNPSGTDWATPMILDSAGNVGQHASLAVVNGFPGISYYDATNRDLKFISASHPEPVLSWQASDGTAAPLTAASAASVAAGTIGSTQLAANAVQTGNIAAGAIASEQLAPNAVQSSNIAAGAVGNAQLAANAVQSGNIANGAVGNTQLAANAVQAGNIFGSSSSTHDDFRDF
jgi:hypothetical protein